MFAEIWFYLVMGALAFGILFCVFLFVVITTVIVRDAIELKKKYGRWF